MKIQDTVFLTVFLLLFFFRKPRWFVWYGLLCLVAAIPFFSFWVFFTAERLTWYAALCFLVFIGYSLLEIRFAHQEK